MDASALSRLCTRLVELQLQIDQGGPLAENRALVMEWAELWDQFQDLMLIHDQGERHAVRILLPDARSEQMAEYVLFCGDMALEVRRVVEPHQVLSLATTAGS